MFSYINIIFFVIIVDIARRSGVVVMVMIYISYQIVCYTYLVANILLQRISSLM